MATLLLAKKLRALYPVDEAAEDIVRRMGQGEIVEVTMRRPRNPKHHRKYFALLGLVWEQLDHSEYPTIETLLTELKIRTGHYDRRDLLVDGKRYPVLTPKSISFANMDQTEFEAFFDRCCDHIAKDVLPGITREDLRREVSILIGAEVGV